MRLFCALLGGMLLVAACSATFDAGQEIQLSSDQFSEAMRWQDYLGAGNFVHRDQRQAFLEQFQQDEDLRVVESRILSIDLNPEARTATADYRLEYYRLPSMRVQKWRWMQEWQPQQEKALKPAVWLIVNPPPLLP